ncbi:hypothetical protein Tsubulata_040844, partial [Turnera subulata]
NLLRGILSKEVSSLKSLRVLNLNDNSPGGGIPDESANLTKLQQPSLRGNHFLGGMPSSGLHLQELRNNKTGEPVMTRPVIFEIMPSSRKDPGKELVFLDLSENMLQGPFPLLLAEMELGSIFLSDNNLSGSLPPRLLESENLSILALSRNNFSGDLPPNIGNATRVMFLMLSGNNFSGQIPKSISHIYRLLLLDVSRNRFSGHIPAFKPDGLLAYLDFSSNEFSGEVPVAFTQDTRLLSLGNNMFFGQLPRIITNLSKLQHLDLQNNKITGELPASLSQMTSLQVLNLRNNSLEGSLPDTFSNLTTLRILDVSSNNLEGEIPVGLGNMVGMIDTPNSLSSTSDVFTFTIEFSDLKVNWKKYEQGLSSRSLDIYSFLDLSKNRLFGEIPPSLGHLKGLKLLNISYNHLSGKIPESFGDLENLESGLVTQQPISNNKLEGEIPQGGQMDTMNDQSYYANNSGLCGMQIRVMCPTAEAPAVPTEVDEIWFSWKAAGIGYSAAFFWSVAIIIFIGCVDKLLPPKPYHRRRRRRV